MCKYIGVNERREEYKVHSSWRTGGCNSIVISQQPSLLSHYCGQALYKSLTREFQNNECNSMPTLELTGPTTKL